MSAPCPAALQPDDHTRTRIIQAAGEIFAKHGFDGAKVRAITQLAGVNLAAVNYHFRDKAELYRLVLLDACSIRTAFREALETAADAPEERLRFLIRRFMDDMLDPDRPEWKRRLMAREMANPTEALDYLIEQNIRPFRDEFLRPILRDLVGPKLGSTEMTRISASIMGQCLYYIKSRPIIERLNPGFQLTRGEVREIADHIAHFSLSALRARPRTSTARKSE